MSLFDLFYNKSIINLYVIFNNRNNKIIIFIDLYIIFILISKFIYMGIGDWGLGIGDWGLGGGATAQSPIPNPQSPIPNPQTSGFFKNKIKR
jgi:hypothetical protein